MIAHFYISLSIGDLLDCRVAGWRVVGEQKVHITQLILEGRDTTPEYLNHLCSKYSAIYRELERKLGFPKYALRFVKYPEATK